MVSAITRNGMVKQTGIAITKITFDSSVNRAIIMI